MTSMTSLSFSYGLAFPASVTHVNCVEVAQSVPSDLAHTPDLRPHLCLGRFGLHSKCMLFVSFTIQSRFGNSRSWFSFHFTPSVRDTLECFLMCVCVFKKIQTVFGSYAILILVCVVLEK